MLFSKSLTYVLTAAWPSQFFDWYSWAVMLAFVFTGGFWVRCTSVGLRRFSSSLVIPLMQVPLLLLLRSNMPCRPQCACPCPVATSRSCSGRAAMLWVTSHARTGARLMGELRSDQCRLLHARRSGSSFRWWWVAYTSRSSTSCTGRISLLY